MKSRTGAENQAARLQHRQSPLIIDARDEAQRRHHAHHCALSALRRSEPFRNRHVLTQCPIWRVQSPLLRTAHGSSPSVNQTPDQLSARRNWPTLARRYTTRHCWRPLVRHNRAIDNICGNPALTAPSVPIIRRGYALGVATTSQTPGWAKIAYLSCRRRDCRQTGRKKLEASPSAANETGTVMSDPDVNAAIEPRLMDVLTGEEICAQYGACCCLLLQLM